MKKIVKKIVLSILIIAMILPTNVSALENNKISDEALINEIQQRLEEKVSGGLKELKATEQEEVRIIVELLDQPIIEYATSYGIRFDDLKSEFIETQSQILYNEQEMVIDGIKEGENSLEVHEQFVNVFNGFSATVPYEDIEMIAKNEQVKSVSVATEYSRPKSLMTDSDTYVKSAYINEGLNYTGAGMVVAIIDTGIDPSHKDFVVDDGVEVALTKESVVSKSGELKGIYFTEKVPYGYNYWDKNTEIVDLGDGASMHGMHVAGIVAANGEMMGVAPNAQLLAMKVFSNNQEEESTYMDIIIAAIDDSIALGADVMNISLGAAAGFVDENSPEQIAVTRAVNNGIVMSISAGNAGHFGSGYSETFTVNPDIGVVSSPGITADSIQVGSINSNITLYKTTATISGISTVTGYGKDKWQTNDYDVVSIGGTKLGYENDYSEIEVEGKVVLVSRGALSFEEKTEIANEEGAIGIIVYDNDGSIFHKDQGGWAIPFMHISTESGSELENLLANSTTNTVTMSISYGADSEYMDPVAGAISDYSSWGTTPTLEFKPEISAPGNNIYSTLNDDSYGSKSGTSMAAPHVAGGSALVLERMKEESIFDEINMESAEGANLAKNILMNTAVPVEETKAYTSPRVQGAGAMNLGYAMETEVVITSEGIAKVSLGEVDSNVLEFDLKVQNYGETTAKYRLSANAQVLDSEGLYSLTSSIELSSETTFEIDDELIGELLEVAPKSSTYVSVKITVDKDELNEIKEQNTKGFFLEGFVSFCTDDEIIAGDSTIINKQIRSKEMEIQGIKSDLEVQEGIFEGLLKRHDRLLEEVENNIEAREDIAEEIVVLMPIYKRILDKHKAILTEEAIIHELESLHGEVSEMLILLESDQDKEGYMANIITYLEQLKETKTETMKEMEEAIKVLEVELEADGILISRAIEIELEIEETQSYITQSKASIKAIESILEAINVIQEDPDLYEEILKIIKLKVELIESNLTEAKNALKDLEEQLTEEDEEIEALYYALLEESEALVKECQELKNRAEELDYERDVTQTLIDQLKERLSLQEEELAILKDEMKKTQGTSYTGVPLSVPYISFVGEWFEANVFDVTVYEDGVMYEYEDGSYSVEYSYYGLTGLGYVAREDEEGSKYYAFLGVGNDAEYYMENIAISPNGDGIKDAATPIFSLLRNLEYVEFLIYKESEDGESLNEIVYLGGEEKLKKNYYNNGNGTTYYLLSEYTWNGELESGVIEDGLYYFEMNGIFNNNNAEESITLPIYVDTVEPVIEKVSYAIESQELQIVALEDGSGVSEYVLYDTDTDEVIVRSAERIIQVEALGERNIMVMANDYAGNVGIYSEMIAINTDTVPEVVEVNIKNGDQNITVGETFELDIEAKLSNGTIKILDSNPQITASNSVVSINGLSVKGEEVGESVVTVTIDGIESSIKVVVSAKSVTPTPSPRPSSSSSSLPRPTVIEEEEIAQAGIGVVREAYIKGYEDGTFRPEAFITRAELSTIIDRIMTLEVSEESTFEDLETVKWAVSSIATMEKASLIKGYGNRLFKPNAYITRAELATILSRAAELIGREIVEKEQIYVDIEGHWAEEAISTIYSMGIEIKEGETEFKPDVELTRAEVVVMINQFIELLIDEGVGEPNFTDVAKVYWAYKHIQAATIK